MVRLLTLRSFLAPLLLALPIAALAAAAIAPRAADDELAERMEVMNSAMRQLSKGIHPETRTKSLERIDAFQRALLDAKRMTPPTAKDVEEAERAEFVAGFRAQLARVLAKSGELEIAVLEGRFDDANRIVAEDMKRLKDQGHEKYAPGEEE
jgi:soluble cytochrome b562